MHLKQYIKARTIQEKKFRKSKKYRKRRNTRTLTLITKHSKIFGRIEEGRTEKKERRQECMKIYKREKYSLQNCRKRQKYSKRMNTRKFTINK